MHERGLEDDNYRTGFRRARAMIGARVRNSGLQEWRYAANSQSR